LLGGDLTQLESKKVKETSNIDILNDTASYELKN
jgi:hypothetical protein